MPETYLIELDEYLRELEKIKAEFDAKIEQLNSEIATLAAEIADIESQVSYWGAKVDEAKAEVASWRDRKTKARALGYALETQPYRSYYDNVRYVKPSYNACKTAFGNYITRSYTGSWRGNQLVYVYVVTPDGSANLGYEYQNYYWLENVAYNKLGLAEDELGLARSQLSEAENALESKTRHMRDLELAREAALEERRNAIALWEAEYQAAQERRRIEIESIARDVQLGYPTMDAETARVIAETAYIDALSRGFTRVADALTIAMNLAQDWYEKQEFPHFTTERVTCPGCNSTLEITKSDITEHNRDLSCPVCNTLVGRGVIVRVIGVWVEPPAPPPPTPPVARILDWLKANWPWLATGGLATALIIAITKRRK